jgi:lipoate-protein ligase A
LHQYGAIARQNAVPLTCFVLPYEVADGPANMATDEALLERVARWPQAAYFRTYGWTAPTLSLGYFQALDQAAAEPRWRSVPIVRRATGGGAIWHHHELTYALVLPTSHPQARLSVALYRLVHEAIATAICNQGLPAGLRTAAGTLHRSIRALERPFLCFDDQDPQDVVAASGKVVGSAQRRRSGAILQHGSILLRQSERTPEHRGICNLAELLVDPLFWSELIEKRVIEVLGLTPCACDPQDRAELRTRVSELERAIYRADAWTARR